MTICIDYSWITYLEFLIPLSLIYVIVALLFVKAVVIAVSCRGDAVWEEIDREDIAMLFLMLGGLWPFWTYHLIKESLDE